MTDCPHTITETIKRGSTSAVFCMICRVRVGDYIIGNEE